MGTGISQCDRAFADVDSFYIEDPGPMDAIPDLKEAFGATASDFDSTLSIDVSAPLGKGKYSVVYRCHRHTNPGQQFALKVITVLPGDARGISRISDEIAIMRSLGKHHGIIELFDIDSPRPNQVSLLLQLSEGGELFDRIHELGRYQGADAKLLIRNLFEAVSFVHSKGIMHRDLKPENIVLSSRQNHTDMKISDFGLAKSKLRARSICGTHYYLSPEVVRGIEYGSEVDIWACGVITYVISCGSLPFLHNDIIEVHRMILACKLVFTDTLFAGVSDECRDFISKLIVFEPERRLSADEALNHTWLL